MAKGKKRKNEAKKSKRSSNGSESDSDDSAGGSSKSSSNSPPSEKQSSASAPKVQVLKTPKSSQVDKNNYKVIQLQNGTRILLISKASATLPSWHHRNTNPYGMKKDSDEESSESSGLSFIHKRDGMPIWRDRTLSNTPVPSTLPFRTDHMNDFDLDENLRPTSHYPKNERAQDPKESRKKFGEGLRQRELTSCSVTINVGGADDPEAHCGLAHFLEHMVHYGSKEYPEEDAYFRWMLENGTNMNAFTQTDTTTYFFECFTPVAATAFDMFSSMLANPLLLEDVVKREIHSVDNEFLLKEHHPIWKILQILCSSAKKKNPLNSFHCGNLASLKNKEKDVKILTKSMRKFHEENYVGSRMTVAIQSNLSLSELEKIATCFNKLKRGTGGTRREIQIDKNYLDPFNTADFRKLNLVTSSHAYNIMKIVWPLPPESWRDFGNRPLDFISHILSQEWEGGLFDTLKKSKNVIDLYAECPHNDSGRNEYCSLFIMNIVLTERGKEVKNLEQILSTIFQGLESINKMSLADKKTLWNEFYVTQKREFDFSGPGKGTNFVASCSRLLQILPEDRIFLSEGVPSPTFDNDVFAQTLQYFNPFDMSVTLCCADFPKSVLDLKKETKKERYTGVKYHQCSWESFKNQNFLKELSKSKPLKIKMSLETNEFFSAQDPSPPSLIRPYRNDLGRLQVEHYGNPDKNVYKCDLQVRFFSPYCRVNERGQKLLALLLLSVCNDEVVRDLQSEIARGGVSSFIGRVRADGIGFDFLGFSSSVIKSAENLLQQVFFAMDHIDENNFNVSKELLLAAHTSSLGNPSSITDSLIRELFIKEQASAEEGLKVIKKIGFRDVLNFSETFRNSAFAQVFAFGNLPKKDLQGIVDVIMELDYQPVLGGISKFVAPPTYLSLPTGNRCIRVRSKCRHCVNTSVTNFYTFSNLGSRNDVVQFTEKMMTGAAFWYLRTYKQLGYVAHTGYMYLLDPVIYITVVGPATKHSACLFDETIDSFLNLFYEMCLEQITQDDILELQRSWNYPVDSFTAEDIRLWYKKQVLPNIRRNEDLVCKWTKKTSANKLSIQVLGIDNEDCKGHTKCDNPKGFQKHIEEDPEKILTFAAEGRISDYFISNIKAYKNGK